MYIGVNDKATKVAKVYIGVNGVAKEVVKGYYGVGDSARTIFTTETCSPSFKGLTYADIKKICLDGKAAETFHKGDYITVPTTYSQTFSDGQTLYQGDVIFEVADLNDYNISYDGTTNIKPSLRLVAKYSAVGIPRTELVDGTTTKNLTFNKTQLFSELKGNFQGSLPKELTDILPYVTEYGSYNGEFTKVGCSSIKDGQADTNKDYIGINIHDWMLVDKVDRYDGYWFINNKHEVKSSFSNIYGMFRPVIYF